MMTARFLLHLRDWEHQASGAAFMSAEGGKRTLLRFNKTTENGNDLGWTINDEFGNDPVLEARENTRKLADQEGSGSDVVVIDESTTHSEHNIP